MENIIEIQVAGRVQGVGFRPYIWRLAGHFGLSGFVRNTNSGVFIVIAGPKALQSAFIKAMRDEIPPLARITAVSVKASERSVEPGFKILESDDGAGFTEVSPDFATCPACREETLDSHARRGGYAFTNCTHCGPRLSIITALPYDRSRTTMAAFPLCEACAAEYANPEDRRFHAEPIACPACGPRLVLERWASDLSVPDDPIRGTVAALEAGEIIAIKALGGYQLACDAAHPQAVARLRAGKRRDGKPFALMARDVAAVARHAEVDALAAAALSAREAPILLLEARKPHGLAPDVAPGLSTLGFMLPSTPLHHLLFERMDRMLVMTSGNLSGDPQITDDEEARLSLAGVAGFALSHNRAIAHRIDDSVARIARGKLRLVRRARGYAPGALPLPPGFEKAPEVLAHGADLKSTFCLLTAGRAILSAHQGDLESASAIDDYESNIALYSALHAFTPTLIAADAHTGYVSTRRATETADQTGVPVALVQHHHAHMAAVMGENGIPRGEKVLAITLDGLGLGDDGTLWGAEILYGDYAGARRVGGLRPTPLPGGDAASREPWRNLVAALATHLSWDEAVSILGDHPIRAALEAKPLPLLRKMMASNLNAPLSSSCGRLFDAVAAALGCGFERQRFEGEAAMALEALCAGTAKGEGYRFGIHSAGNRLEIDPAPFWRALLKDLVAGRSAQAMARDFHAGWMHALSESVMLLTQGLAAKPKVALSGGSFQNLILFNGMIDRLEVRGFTVLTHSMLPNNDGGIAFGQALVAAARQIEPA